MQRSSSAGAGGGALCRRSPGGGGAGGGGLGGVGGWGGGRRAWSVVLESSGFAEGRNAPPQPPGISPGEARRGSQPGRASRCEWAASWHRHAATERVYTRLRQNNRKPALSRCCVLRSNGGAMIGAGFQTQPMEYFHVR